MVSSAYSEEKAKAVKGYLLSDDDMKSVEKRGGEFDFFISQARKTGGPVLELASGAARMLMVLAEAGFEVFGVEASTPMLKLAKKAIARLPETTQKRIHLIQGDMCQFAFSRPFPLIIIPYNSFWYNFIRVGGNGYAYYDEFGYGYGEYSLVDQSLKFGLAKKCLVAIMDCLEKGGLFVIDSPEIHSEKLSWWQAMAEELRFSYEVLEPYRSYYLSSDLPCYVEVLVGRKL